MFKKRLLTSAIVSAIAISNAPAFAAGFQLNSQSATGLGRAFAGDAVITDNASVAARNPAAMALFKEANFSLGFNVIATDVRLKGTYNDIKIPDFTITQEDISGTDDIGGTSFVQIYIWSCRSMKSGPGAFRPILTSVQLPNLTTIFCQPFWWENQYKKHEFRD